MRIVLEIKSTERGDKLCYGRFIVEGGDFSRVNNGFDHSLQPPCSQIKSKNSMLIYSRSRLTISVTE